MPAWQPRDWLPANCPWRVCLQQPAPTQGGRRRWPPLLAGGPVLDLPRRRATAKPPLEPLAKAMGANRAGQGLGHPVAARAACSQIEAGCGFARWLQPPRRPAAGGLALTGRLRELAGRRRAFLLWLWGPHSPGLGGTLEPGGGWGCRNRLRVGSRAINTPAPAHRRRGSWQAIQGGLASAAACESGGRQCPHIPADAPVCPAGLSPRPAAIC